MKLMINPKTFFKALQPVAICASSKHRREYEHHGKITLIADKEVVASTNTGTMAIRSVCPATILEPGAVTVQATDIFGIIRSYHTTDDLLMENDTVDRMVTIHYDEKEGEEGQNSLFPFEAPITMWSWPDQGAVPATAMLPRDFLIQASTLVRFPSVATSDELTYATAGVWAGNEYCYMAAGDGRQYVVIEQQDHRNPHDPTYFALPLKSLQAFAAIIRALPKTTSFAITRVSENLLQIKSAGVSIMISCDTSVSWPDPAPTIHRAHVYHLQTTAEDWLTLSGLAPAWNRVDQKGHRSHITLDVLRKRLVVTATDDHGKASRVLNIKNATISSGAQPSLEIELRTSFLLDVAQQVERLKASRIDIGLQNSSSPMVVTLYPTTFGEVGLRHHMICRLISNW